MITSTKCNHCFSDCISNNCLKCGLYKSPKTNNQGKKSARFNDLYLLDYTSLFKSYKKSTSKFNILSQIDVDIQVTSYLIKIINKYRIRIECQAKALYIYYQMTTNKIIQYFKKFRIAASCLYFTLKILQTNVHIPSLSIYIKNTGDIINYGEYVQIESEIIQELNNMNVLEISTYVDFVTLFMVNGICFTNESVSIQDCQRVIMQLTYMHLMNGNFILFDQFKLAIYILFQARKLLDVKQIWPPQIQEYTEITTLELYNIIKELKHSKYFNKLKRPLRRRQNISDNIKAFNRNKIKEMNIRYEITQIHRIKTQSQLL